MIQLTAYRGDSMSFTIPLTNGTAAFTPGGSYSLIFTAKRSSKDPDTAAVFQKSTATGTITTSTTNAIVTVLYTDTTTEEEPVLYWDIQAQHNSTAAVITAAKGTLTLVRDITRQTTASVPIYTVDPAAGNATPAGTAGSVQINNAGALAADSGLVYTGTGNTGVLKIGGGSVIMSDPTVSQNVAIGGGNPTLPFAYRTTGNYNTSIGTSNLPLLTTGSKNVAIGTSTLANVTTGSDNFGFGVNTLYNLTSGTNNIAIGTGVAANIITGADNICIGGSPLGAANVSSIAIGADSDGSSTTVIGRGGNAPNTQTRLIGNTLILGRQDLTTGTDKRTLIVQTAQTDNKTITLPNANGKLPVYTNTPVAGKVLTATDDSGAATWQTPAGGAGTVTSITAGTGLSGGTITTTGTIALANTAVTAGEYTIANITVDAQGRITAAASGSSAGSVTGTAPIVVSSGVISLSTTLPSAYAFTSTTRPTSSGTGTPDATSLIKRDDVDTRLALNYLRGLYIWSNRHTDYSATNVGTGSSSTNINVIDLTTGATAGSVSFLRSNIYNFRVWHISLGTGRGVVNWSLRTVYNLRVVISDITGADTVARFLLGQIFSSTTAQDFTTADKGIGFKIIAGLVYVQVANATILTTTSTATTIVGVREYDLTLDSDGAGNWVAYINGSNVASGTGAPTGNSTAGNNALCMSITNGTTAATRQIYVVKQNTLQIP